MIGTSSPSVSTIRRSRKMPNNGKLVIPADVAIVVANGPHMEEDIARLQEPFDVMAINRSMLAFKRPIKYWATWHDSDDEEWRTCILLHASNGYGMPLEGFSHCGGRFATHLPINCYGGGSTLYGALVCLNHLGYRKVIVANSPLSGHYVEFLEGWRAALAEIKDKVRALSGEPKELLGEPTQEWLDS